jgi:hypothetical protein
MQELVIVLAKKDKEALGTVRCLPGLQVAEIEGTLWVRGIEAAEKPDLSIRQLPAVHTYRSDEGNYIFPTGGLTPVGKMPNVTWIPIAEFIRPELPTSALPGKVVGGYTVKLVPSDRAEAGSALLTDLAVWKEYAGTAPEVRLAQLRFAVSERNQALVLGTPLPPVPGREYWGQGNLLLPAGFDFELPLVAGLLAAKLNPRNDSFVLFNADGSWERIALSNLATSTRSAVRLSQGKEIHD